MTKDDTFWDILRDPLVVIMFCGGVLMLTGVWVSTPSKMALAHDRKVRSQPVETPDQREKKIVGKFQYSSASGTVFFLVAGDNTVCPISPLEYVRWTDNWIDNRLPYTCHPWKNYKTVDQSLVELTDAMSP